MTTSTASISEIASQRGSVRSILMICILVLAGNVLSAGWHVSIKTENGALELLSFLCLSLAAIISFAFYREGTIRLWAIPAVLALLALREVDFQDWWFDPGVLRAAIFSEPVPIWHKAVSALAMAAILIILLTLAIRGARPVFRALLSREAWAIALFVSGCCVAAALVFDGSERNFAAIGITLSPYVAKVVSYGEEIVEFAFAFLLVVSVILFARKHR